MLDKAEYSAFESTLNCPIVSYRIVHKWFRCCGHTFTSRQVNCSKSHCTDIYERRQHHILTYYLLPTNLKSLQDGRDKHSRSFSKIFANPIPVSITFFHLSATILSSFFDLLSININHLCNWSFLFCIVLLLLLSLSLFALVSYRSLFFIQLFAYSTTSVKEIKLSVCQSVSQYASVCVGAAAQPLPSVLKVEKEMPGRPNPSSPPCPSPLPSPLLQDSESPVGVETTLPSLPSATHLLFFPSPSPWN